MSKKKSLQIRNSTTDFDRMVTKLKAKEEKRMSDKTTQNGWTETTLGEVAEKISYGYTESATQKKVGPKFLRITDIQDDYINWNTVPFCPISEKNHQKYMLEVGDIVIARTGNSTGATATIKQNVNAVFASYLIRFKINHDKADFQFIDFLLRSHIWQGFVKSIKGGSAQGGANAKNFAEFPILIPSIPEQRNIALVLSSFDNKIELLRNQNQTLEDMAHALFKEWFVEFNFPDQNGKPYKKSGGKMAPCDIGKIPEGWRVYELRELFSFVKGKKPKETCEKYKDEFLPQILIEVFDGKKSLLADPEKAIISEKDDLIMVMDGASSGRIEFGFAGVIGSTLALLNSQKDINSILYFFLKKKERDIRENTTGSAIPHTDKERVYNYKIILPETGVERFEQMFSNFREKIILNRSQIQTLTLLRDTLLPKLMSGEVRVKM